jgi:hypothetical protein
MVLSLHHVHKEGLEVQTNILNATSNTDTNTQNNANVFQKYTVNEYKWNELKDEITKYTNIYTQYNKKFPIKWNVGTISLVSQDQPQRITITGNLPNLYLNFYFPCSIQGIQGPSGINGEDGPQGNKGIKGEKGLPVYPASCKQFSTMVNNVYR